ncbi:hypothetical protein AYR61_00215 [Secundilactobacillus paracollinoides]|uniref:Gram-positive cocci surface proteins LPxTG domain-containing protein n=1 Tax=Secundilactobacillus paracollinoides TaxID=240427 RepID=A0A1B2IUL6_9LACO|nr:hypothetical protein AYR61_00215 [Secundilactobacillus paracollinoides]ANZ65722.1 hypothetical protein AYR63_00220 [Secundilactobacillus paracollinoides]
MAASQTVSGDYGSPYTTSAEPVTGYSLVATPANATGTLSTNNADVIYYYTANDETATIHYYLAGTTDSIEPDSAATGKYGESYETSAPTFDGYTVATTPSNATGIFTTDTPAIIYTYTANTETVTVHYVDADGVSLSDDTTSTGAYNTPYTTTPATVTGYHVSTTPTNAAGTYQVDNADVTYVYSPDTETVTVHYVDSNNTTISPDQTVSGNYGSPYETNPATVEGYTLTTTPSNAMGTLDVTNAAVTYVYTADTETVTVSYVDQNNQTIHPSTTQSGAYKSDYEMAPLPIDGYTLTTTPANATGTYDVTNPEVVYVYTANTETVTISYVDQNNQSIQASTTQSGAYNSAYTTAPATIEGYTLTTTPTNATGTYGLTDTEVVYVYSADPETVIVRYEDTTGKTIWPSTTLDGNYNESYSAEAATVSGYTLNSYTEKTSGSFCVTNPDVVYVYTADPETLTVRYEDSNGQSIIDPTTVEGVYNGSYTTEPKTIEGYTLASSTDNTTGTYTVDTPDVVYTYTADPETVTVVYQNTDGQSIANSEVLTGDYATSYESQAKTIAGYTLTSTPTNATGTYGVSNADVVYTYTADSETVTVRYEDTTGKTISDPTTLTGAYGTDYAATPATIAGYTLNSYTEKTSGTFDVTNPDVVYVYTADPETVTVRYEDTNGNSISNATTLTGNYGTGYAATPKTLTGYTLNSMTEKTSGTYTVTNPDVVYVYTADPEAVIVRYEDSEGNTISDPTTLDGNFNETYTTAAKTITGYTLSSPSATTTGTYGVANEDVVYTYTADPESVTVRYEDTTGNVISAPTTLDGNFGTDYAATPKDITGYTLNSYTEKTSGTFGVTNPDVVYVYTADPETVTVRYEDTNGNTISDSTTLSGNYGTDYAATAKTLTGYTLNSMTEKTSGTYDVTNPDVVYVYTADPETVTVHYVDADGNTISTDTTKNGSFGGSYTTAPKTITGYTLSTTPTNADGTYTVTTPDVTYVYTANTETVTVHYVDANGETLSADTTEQGAYGTAYTTQPATVTGYTLTATPTNADGTYSEGTPDVTYVYAPDTESVTVHYYIAGTTTPVSPDTTLSGAYGTAYTSSAATVSGYTLTSTPTNADGTYYGVTNADIVYYYTQNAPTTGGSTGTDSGSTGSGSDATGTGSGSTGTDTGNTGSGSTNSGSDATSGKGGSGSGSDVTTTTAGNTGTTGKKQTGHVSAVSKTDNQSGNGTSGTAGQAGTTGQAGQATDLTTSTNAASADGNGSNTTTDTNGDTNVSGNTDTTAGLNADGQTTNNQLPQTNETNQSSEAAEVAGLGILATLAGLFGFKRKRKHDED